eukprot:108796-Pyramimonas_sp.AAC.1
MEDQLLGEGGDQEREDGFKLFSQAAMLQSRALVELQRLLRVEQRERNQLAETQRSEAAAFEDKFEKVVNNLEVFLVLK